MNIHTVYIGSAEMQSKFYDILVRPKGGIKREREGRMHSWGSWEQNDALELQ